jgi:hypothetical protein
MFSVADRASSLYVRPDVYTETLAYPLILIYQTFFYSSSILPEARTFVVFLA